MILVADSGSTKCDWILIDQSNTQRKTSTMGLNPFFHDTKFILEKLKENEIFKDYKLKIKEIYFYGAGCSSEDRKIILKNALSQFFTFAKRIVVDHDLTAAVLATSQYSPSISCILGTGSNSCFFDGENIIEHLPALGYIIGDEGSGSYFGKILLADWLYNRMPPKLHSEFQEKYELNKEGIFEAIYRKKHPNVYLASFMPFVKNHQNHPYMKEMVYQGLAKFINIHVWCYDNFREIPVNFVGSIAYYFRNVLEEIAKNHRFTIGKIEKKPIFQLVEHHLNNQEQTI
tara:strand:- start:551 stop:1411 length:861 start_codon:yes stop_codon:yes gene_type:complete